ncbi:unnamed protein product [Penicillium salamii]|uniref:Dicer-like protein 1 n=1 Tax=Penicillium salamii TaxID=1612424 RepID=A0A9W4I8T2_9EURO|nr:unnamed protein product [Penicillium salamii]
MAYTMSSDPHDSDSDIDEPVALPLEKSQQRRSQNAVFTALLEQHVIDESNNGPEEDTCTPKAEVSVACLIADQGVEAGALDPREYQIQLFEKAKIQNTIAVLDTGSGKTLVAVLLLKYILERELLARAEGAKPRISFFLVDSVTLVFQQSTVLRNNINQKVAQFYGALGSDMWDKEIWRKHLENYMVIVCTADILNQALLNGHVKIDQINLLIFDEAHHAKKEHPYARIIRETYLTTDPTKRPRVFGMTASPVDAKCDIAEAAIQLETLMDCHIATTSNISLLRQFVSKPTEEEWVYEKLPPPFETELHGILKARYGDLQHLSGIFQFSLNASSELGPWCADQVWVLALADEVVPKLQAVILKDAETDPQILERVENEIERTREASEFAKKYVLENSSRPNALSSKVELLLGKLGDQFVKHPDTKCIVFTERRNTAKVLLQLCKNKELLNLRPDVLVGVRRGDTMGMNVTFRQQFLALLKFRKGEVNCLFATSVAEEGLDIPDCNLVVRFNIYETVIQYVQSRGRARHSDSVYATMIEERNRQHQMRLQEVKKAELLMRNFCNMLPADRRLYGTEHDLEDIMHGEGRKRSYTVAATGAKLTYRHAIDVLGRFASSLQYAARVTYIVISENDSFSCEIILPEKSPIRGIIGCPEVKKSVAKQSAAFDACLLLRKNNLLDDHFNSIYHKRLPAMRNAKLAITSKKTDQYTVRNKPTSWLRGQGITPTRLYATVICLVPTEPLNPEPASIILFTRDRLPEFPTFPVYLDNDIETTVHCSSLDGYLEVTPFTLGLLTDFTLTLFHDIFKKTYSPVAEAFPYWLAPLHEMPTKPVSGRSTSTFDMIDWDTLHYVQDNPEIKWSADMEPESLLNQFMYDDWNGKYRYFTTAIDHHLRPSDPPPYYAPLRKWNANILNWSLSLSKNSRSKFFNRCDWSQPVLQAELISSRRNFLDKASDEEKVANFRCVLCPQAVNISPLSVPIVTACLAFPSIISRLESYLIAREGCEMLGLDVRLEYALEAFTKDSDNTEEHRSLQVHVQRGMGKNYERLELLGDSVLKLATTISLFVQNPEDDEYDYHVNRMCLICNKNLFINAKKRRLYEYVRSRGFSRHLWYPPGLSLEVGRDHAKFVINESQHALAEKTIADVCEALIGASLLSGRDENRFDRSIKAVTVLVNSPTHTATSWKDYISMYSLPSYQIQTADAFEENLSEQVAGLGYKFKYPRLLRSAFTHPSYPLAWSKVPCYQRLEFLGDALLDMVCVEHLFHRFPDRDPQWLTEHKMAMVSNKFLGALAVKLGFHKHLQHFSNALMAQITNYAEETLLAEQELNGEVDYWLSTTDSPKCLPDMLEAYLGAIFVDSGFDFAVIEAFFETHMMAYFQDMSIYDTFANRHPTTFLHSQLNLEYRCSDYCLKSGTIMAVDGETPKVLSAVIVHGMTVAKAVASSGRYAKVKASSRALTALEGMSRAAFRKKYKCDCRGDQIQDMEFGTAI